jgi:hypothetical protein
MITLENGSFGWDYIINCCETGETVLIQTDHDYEGVASAFGWTGAGSAQDYLDEVADSGTEVTDPGYFSN